MKKNSFQRFYFLWFAVIASTIGIGFGLSSFAHGPNPTVQQTLLQWGDEKPLHYLEKVDPILVEKGKSLVYTGKAVTPNGKKGTLISKYFVCVDCHNTQLDYDFNSGQVSTNVARLEKDGIPFLPATTFKGLVNRTSWYNGDYTTKYGERALHARDTLRNAIQLCATTCSQGRRLDPWEEDAIVHYLWSLELQFSDVDAVLREQTDTIASNKEKITHLKTGYLTAYPASFSAAIPLTSRELGVKGNTAEGAYIYQTSCLHCHSPQAKKTNYQLNTKTSTFRWLSEKLSEETMKSVYEIVRSGTHSSSNYKPYMPQFTLEKLSDEQIESLVAYIVRQGEGK